MRGALLSFFRRVKYMVRRRTGRAAGKASPVAAFGIRAGYRHRSDNSFFDDTGLEDDWQREVYETAADAARALGARTVYDVGCGSGFKLMKHFADLRTIGFDLEPTVSFLKSTYPDRDWRVCRFDDPIEEPADIVICSDVVEHIPDPDQLMEFLAELSFRKLFLSTPERGLLYGFDQTGPPSNPSHCREWTMEELKTYVSRWFEIEEHEISNRPQATQMMVCRPNVRGESDRT